MKPKALETLLLLECLAVPLLPVPASAAVLAATAALWLLLRPPAREVWVTGTALAAAVAALAAGWYLSREGPLGAPRWTEQATARYEALWQDLEARAEAARARLGGPPGAGDRGRQAAFEALAAAAEAARPSREALLLLDPNLEAFAWAGQGLLHDLDVDRLPPRGRAFQASFGAATLLAVRPLSDDRRPWRLVAGRTYPTAALPFDPPGPGRAADFRWSLAEPGLLAQDQREAGTVGGRRLLAPVEGPVLIAVENVRRSAPPPSADDLAEEGMARTSSGAAAVEALSLKAALALIGLALVALAVLRGVGLAMPGAEPEGGGQVAWLGIGGAAAWALAATGSALATLALVAGFVLVAFGLRFPGSGRSFQPVTFKGFSVAAVLVAAGWYVQQAHGQPVDLGAGILATPAVFCLRIAFCAAAFGLFLLSGREDPEVPEPGHGWAWISAALLGGAAAFHDQVAVGATLLAAGSVTTAVWTDPRRLLRSPASLSVLALLAALASASAWELTYRAHLRDYLEDEVLAGLAPPVGAELEAAEQELKRHFAILDLESLVPRDPEGLDLQDLAYLVWRDSPLARRSSLSALVVRPVAQRGPGSAFAFGLELDESLETAALPADLEPLPLWDQLEIRDQGWLLHGGQHWARVRYWARPRPGFGLGAGRWQRRLEEALLRPAADLGPSSSLPEPAVYALYDDRGHPLLIPWKEAPPLAPALRLPRPEQRRVETPAGEAWAWSQQRRDGWEVLYLPALTPLAALDRVGTQALSVVTLLTAVAVLIMLLALPRQAFRDLLRRAVQSYSKRLLLVYSLLLLIPLPLLNVALVGGLEKRLWSEKRTEGEAALLAAQRYLAEYIENLEPGFGIIPSMVDRLPWLSNVVQHDVNLYWGSELIASSRRELITAGFLPRRIPGEIFSRLALGGFNLASRTHLVGTTPYVELYVPVRLPGEGRGSKRLFLAVPLLAQQEEIAEELVQLRRQALLFTALLFFVMVAVSVRLAQSFTRPITELVEGTRRIAAGAPSLDVRPTELELTALAEAVDDMARRVAESREGLLREKEVVERMVQNITSGVVSLDAEHRVLLRNQVARELIGAEVGDRLEDALGREERLEPVAGFVRRVGESFARTTVRLAGAEASEREWSLVWVPLPGHGEPSALLVVEDATEVLRGQRLQAWAEMARIIAHEIKNPLTPIRLSAEHMQQVYATDRERFDEVFERCTANILKQVEELREIAADFSTYSSIPRIDPRPGDLVAAVGDLVEAYRAAPPPGIQVVYDPRCGEIETRFDAKLVGRAVRNLLENAVRASAGGGEVVVKVESSNGLARVSVADHGPGVEPELLGRIFDPYFSTHDTGTGLGLPIVRRIAEEHGGSVTASNRSGGGLEVAFTIPT